MSDIRATVGERDEDKQGVIDAMVERGRVALHELGLSRVSDAGSLKRDEAWDAVKIMRAEIARLRARVAELEAIVARLRRKYEPPQWVDAAAEAEKGGG